MLKITLPDAIAFIFKFIPQSKNEKNLLCNFEAVKFKKKDDTLNDIPADGNHIPVVTKRYYPPKTEYVFPTIVLRNFVKHRGDLNFYDASH